jgi:hypothetical protein
MSISKSSSIPDLWGRAATAILLAGGIASCSSVAEQAAPVPESPALVSQGYTLMYDTVGQLKFTDELLLIKVEDDKVDAIVGEVSGYAAELEGELEELSERDSVVRLDLKLLPEIELRKRESVAGERLPDLLGESGPAFERLLLLTQSGALNQSRHLARVMVDLEEDPARKAFWINVQTRFDDLYARLVELLEARYFKDSADIVAS